MTSDNFGFCPHCGENLKSDAAYCPACGTVLKEEVVNQSVNARYGGRQPMSGVFLLAFVLLVLYAIMELISSISLLSMNSETYHLMDQIMLESEGLTFAEWCEKYLGIAFTEEEFLRSVFLMGIFGFVSAVLSGVSAFLCYKRKNNIIAVGACALSAVAAFLSTALVPMAGGFVGALPTLLIGLIVAYMVYVSKKAFDN